MELQQDVEQIQEICSGCKTGVEWYQRISEPDTGSDSKLHHIDLFAAYGTDRYFPCLAENLVEKYIIGYKEDNSAILTAEFDKLMFESVCENDGSDED